MAEEWRYVPTDALDTFRPFGIRTDSAFVAFVGAMIAKPVTPYILAALFCGVLTGVVYSRFVKDKPDGFIYELLSVAFTNDFCNRYLPFLGFINNDAWKSRGLPPSPTSITRYDP